MITKSAAAIFKKQTNNNAKYLGLTTAHQRKFAGGGPKKAAMPASETDFDIVFVGMPLDILKFSNYRWNECYCIVKVLAS
jgi:hypothetical protein